MRKTTEIKKISQPEYNISLTLGNDYIFKRDFICGTNLSFKKGECIKFELWHGNLVNQDGTDIFEVLKRID